MVLTGSITGFRVPSQPLLLQQKSGPFIPFSNICFCLQTVESLRPSKMLLSLPAATLTEIALAEVSHHPGVWSQLSRLCVCLCVCVRVWICAVPVWLRQKQGSKTPVRVSGSGQSALPASPRRQIGQKTVPPPAPPPGIFTCASGPRGSRW